MIWPLPDLTPDNAPPPAYRLDSSHSGFHVISHVGQKGSYLISFTLALPSICNTKPSDPHRLTSHPEISSGTTSSSRTSLTTLPTKPPHFSIHFSLYSALSSLEHLVPLEFCFCIQCFCPPLKYKVYNFVHLVH